MWEYFTLKRAGARKILADAAHEKKRRKARLVAMGVSLQRGSGTSQMKCGYRLRCPDTARRAYNAKKFGTLEGFTEECRKEGKLCEWTFERIREACEKVAMDDIGLSSIANRDSSEKARTSWRGMGGVTLSYVCPHCNCFPLEDYIWWVSMGHG